MVLPQPVQALEGDEHPEDATDRRMRRARRVSRGGELGHEPLQGVHTS